MQDNRNKSVKNSVKIINKVQVLLIKENNIEWKRKNKSDIILIGLDIINVTRKYVKLLLGWLYAIFQ